MAATTLDLSIEQGATFAQAVSLGASYDGQTPRAVVRCDFADGGPVLVELACTVVASGSTTLSLTAAQTAALRAGADNPDRRAVPLGYWDLETEAGGVVVRHRHGRVTLSREATR